MRNKSSGELSFPVPSPSAGQPEPPNFPLPLPLPLSSLPFPTPLLPQLGMGNLRAVGEYPLISLIPYSHSSSQQPLRGCCPEGDAALG